MHSLYRYYLAKFEFHFKKEKIYLQLDINTIADITWIIANTSFVKHRIFQGQFLFKKANSYIYFTPYYLPLFACFTPCTILYFKTTRNHEMRFWSYNWFTHTRGVKRNSCTTWCKLLRKLKKFDASDIK